ncbi:putative Activator of Hsp90 ATPase 1 family protein [Nostocoides japonicum T1-X7]|uniref:Putative Activator of Hsp90 ATPase 1 family protein n=1 Tax=Nostocoides japonicum T1-X7 TaxID=1194083 RepID=A0A077LYG9_9MICO|nr:SRPBCC domain-containing protein [Tetrasphaera japonica]CCH77957.1 putative Activator of Hsp90 ATPase 1 family protein [Tetrasphaera japonica T1-X7]
MTETQVEQTEDAATVAVSRMIAAPPVHVWEVLVSPPGSEAILGRGATLGSKGQSWHSDEGSVGCVRSFHPVEQIRVSWHETPDAPRSVVEIDVVPDGTSTRVDLRHDRVSGDVSSDEARWNAALDRFADVVAR